MKHAFMVVAHDNFDILKRQIMLLDNPNVFFFIHIDKHANFKEEMILNQVKFSKVVFIERKKIFWGGYSQIDCELRLLKRAVKEDFVYCHLLSGSDLPIKTFQEIDSFFENNKGKEFIHYESVKLDFYTQNRVKFYHLIENRRFKKINTALLLLQRIFKVDRLKHSDMVLAKGANWFSITHEMAEFILSKEAVIRKMFNYSLCADELFVQTLVFNSNFKNKLYYQKFDNNYISCMRYIDWNRGKPYVFSTSDFDELVSSPHLFARKFDYKTSPEIVDMIFKYLKSKD